MNVGIHTQYILGMTGDGGEGQGQWGLQRGGSDRVMLRKEEEEQRHVFVRLQSADGIQTGAPLSIPASTTPQQLESLLNELLQQQEEPLPYSFFVEEVEISRSIQQDVASVGREEGILTVVYRPQAIFKVDAVSRCSSTMAGHDDVILCVAYSPDGTRLATGGGDCSVRFWDLNTATPLTTTTMTKGKDGAHSGWILCLAWSPDGRWLASGGMDGKVQIWEGQTGRAVGAPLTGHLRWITHLCWEPLHLRAPCARLVSSSRDGTARIWNLPRRQCELVLSQHTDAITSMRWGGDGTIYTASRDRTIRMWNGDDGRLKGVLSGHAHWINTLALSTDYVLRTGAFEGGSRDRDRDRVVDEGGSDHSPSDGQELQQRALLRYREAVGKEGERLVSGSDDFTLFLWRPHSTNKPVARLNGHQALVNHVAFSPDGRLLASAAFDKSVKLWNGLNGQFLTSLRGHVGRVYQLAWSADSRLLLSSSQDSTLKVWDVRTRTLKRDLSGHLDEVYAVDWSPKGDSAASGGKDKMIKLWNQ